MYLLCRVSLTIFVVEDTNSSFHIISTRRLNLKASTQTDFILTWLDSVHKVNEHFRVYFPILRLCLLSNKSINPSRMSHYISDHC